MQSLQHLALDEVLGQVTLEFRNECNQLLFLVARSTSTGDIKVSPWKLSSFAFAGTASL